MTLARAAGRCRPGARSCFAAGLLLIAVALFSPIGHIDEELVIAHMVEHLLIGDLAALLLVLGLTGPLLQPVLAIPVSAGFASSPTPWSRCRSGPSTSSSGTSPPSTRTPTGRSASTPSSTPASSSSAA